MHASYTRVSNFANFHKVQFTVFNHNCSHSSDTGEVVPQHQASITVYVAAVVGDVHYRPLHTCTHTVFADFHYGEPNAHTHAHTHALAHRRRSVGRV